jgi:hypothetical protein
MAQEDRLLLLANIEHFDVLLLGSHLDPQQEAAGRFLLAESKWRLAEMDARPALNFFPGAPISRFVPAATLSTARPLSAYAAEARLSLVSLWHQQELDPASRDPSRLLPRPQFPRCKSFGRK